MPVLLALHGDGANEWMLPDRSVTRPFWTPGSALPAVAFAGVTCSGVRWRIVCRCQRLKVVPLHSTPSGLLKFQVHEARLRSLRYEQAIRFGRQRHDLPARDRPDSPRP